MAYMRVTGVRIDFLIVPWIIETFKINAPRSFETSGTIYPTLQVRILEDLRIPILLRSQQLLQHAILARKIKERNNLKDPVADHRITR